MTRLFKLAAGMGLPSSRYARLEQAHTGDLQRRRYTNTDLAGCRDYAALRPDVWKLAHPEAVRIYRQDERRHRAEVKSAKRARRRTGRR